MGVFSDTIDEFKKAKPPEKMLIIGAGVAIIAIIIYLRNKSASQGTVGQGGPTGSTGLIGSSGNTGSSGSSGSSGSTGSGSTGSGSGSGGTQGGGNPPTNPVPQPNPTPSANPNQPFFYGGNYSNLAWGTTYNYGGQRYQLATGGGNRLWGVLLQPGQSPYTVQQFNTIPLSQKFSFSPNGVQAPQATSNTANVATPAQGPQTSAISIVGNSMQNTYANSGRRYY